MRVFANVWKIACSYKMASKVRYAKVSKGNRTGRSGPVVSTVWDPQRQHMADTGKPKGGMIHDDDKSGRRREVARRLLRG